MKFSWINDHSRIFFERGYLEKGVGPEQRVRQIADAAERYLNIAGFGDKFYDYMSHGWISLASPIWSNYGLARGLPCSCNGQFVDDTMESILLNAAEMGVMTKHGAGTSGYFGKLRGRGIPISGGGESSGPVHFLEIYDSISSVVSQSNVRRGSFAAYLDVEHPDILEFLEIRKEGHRIQDISIGVCIGDDWMNAMVSGDKKKRKVWAAIIQKRFETGYPYIFFTDTVNNNKPQVYKDKDVKIHASNLCSEIALSSSNEESFVCVLSSVNLLHYDDWKDTDLIETMMFFLDTVTEEYIIKTKGIKLLEKAHNFAKNQRAVGLGTLGWHSYLQSNNIAFESMEAKIKNAAIFKDIHLKSLEASKKLASLYGEPPMLKGYGERFMTRLSTAPNVSCTTADTKFLDGDGNSINFHQLFKRGGLDLNDYLYTEVIGSNGESIKMNPYDKVSIMRDSERLVVQVVDLEEGDEIIELTNKW